MRILISGIGGPTPRSIALRLRKLYPNAQLIGTDASPKAIGFYLPQLLDFYELVPRASDPDYWRFIKTVIEKYHIDFAFIQPELEVIEWGRYYEKYGNYLCPVLIPPLVYATNLVDKAKMADILVGTKFIPRTLRLLTEKPNIQLVEREIGFPCWIRASIGSGGLGALKINRSEDLKAWLLIHQNIPEFTVSEFLPGRHLANQMLYLDGKLIRNAGLHCVEYVMANIAPSKVTGNTSFGRFINEEKLLSYCEECMDYLADRFNVPPHGIFSFDLKEDRAGELKVTEINVRHMAYTGIMAEAGFDLIDDTVQFLEGNQFPNRDVRFSFTEERIFLRDVDITPILLKESDLLIPQ